MIPNGYLSQNVRLVKVADAATSGTSDVPGGSVDMAGAEGVLFFSSFGTSATNNTIKAQQSSDNSSSDAWADLAGSSVGVGASDEDVFIDIFRPRERYVRPVVTRGTASALGDIWAIVYGLREVPHQNVVSGTQVGETTAAPAEGTP